MKKTTYIFFFLVLSITSFSQNLPMFRGNLNRSGVFDSSEITLPVVKWKFRTNGQIYSSAVVVDDVVYIGSNDSYLYALNTSDGSLKWKFKTRRRIKSTPCVENNTVFFGSYDSTFYAVDTKTGKEKWHFKTGCEAIFSAKNIFGVDAFNQKAPDPWDFYFSSPIVFNNAVYFGSGDSSIYCLNINTGEKIWSFKTKGIVHSSPAIQNDILYCGSWDSKIYALDTKTGKLIWDFQTGTDSIINCFVGIQASPAIADGVVYCGSRDAHMYALESKTGKLIWKKKDVNSSWLPSSVAIKGNYLYTGSSDAQKFYIYDRKNGNLVSDYLTGLYPFSSPSISGRTAYIGSYYGSLYAFDINTGFPIWTFTTDAALNSLYFTKEGDINREAAKDNNEFGKVWEMIKEMEQLAAGSGGILSSPFIYKSEIFFGATDGYIYALTNGKELTPNVKRFIFSDIKTAMNSENILNYSIEKLSKVVVTVWNNQSKLVKILQREEKQPGNYSIKWDGTDKANKKVEAGEYTIRITIDRYSKYYPFNLKP